MDLFDHVARASIDRLLPLLGIERRQRTEAYELLAVQLRAASPALYEALARNDARVTELLEANNRLLEERRAATERAEAAEAELARRPNLPDAMTSVETAAAMGMTP